MGLISGFRYLYAHVLGLKVNEKPRNTMGANKGGKCRFCGQFIGPASGFPQRAIVTRQKRRYCSEDCALHRRTPGLTTTPAPPAKREDLLRLSRSETETLFAIHWATRHTKGGTNEY